MEYYKKRKKEIVESILSTISYIRDNEYNKIENAYNVYEQKGAKHVTNIGQNTFNEVIIDALDEVKTTIEKSL
jgi:t-SNARE complex subunit (syntaxin)